MAESYFLLVVPVLLSHEAGHALAAQLLGLRWRPVLSRRGVGVAIGCEGRRLTRFQAGVTGAGGPAASLLLVAVLWRLGFHLPALASLELCVLNLLPFKRSDGRKVWAAIRGGKLQLR